MTKIDSTLPLDMDIEDELSAPSGYKGLSAFHKYWGKKPVEYLSYLVEKLTVEHEIVLDPFLGSGLIARETVRKNRRFIGTDINPVAVEMSRLFLDLPSYEQFNQALLELEQNLSTSIHRTYRMDDGKTASHYLWENGLLKTVWHTEKRRGKHEEREPTSYDIETFREKEDYQFRYPRQLNHFNNARINTHTELTFADIFSGRARYNIDLLLDAIYRQPDAKIKRALLLCLTSASGQMSKMVFAITRRGKMTGELATKVEVGSWVIGYWRPKVHFEINVWNCFHNRASSILKVLRNQELLSSRRTTEHPIQVIYGRDTCSIVEGDATETLFELPENSISLIITDPPHSDRIPYLELSEMWNALLNKEVNYTHEIVVSNARTRNKTKSVYSDQMGVLLGEMVRVLKPGKILAILFNARDKASWNFLSNNQHKSKLIYKGCLPLAYSANSVVQDNRKGGLKMDYILFYQKHCHSSDAKDLLAPLVDQVGWSFDFPSIDSPL